MTSSRSVPAQPAAQAPESGVITNAVIVVPVYNEERYVGQFASEVTEALATLPAVREVVFVDDGSSDATPAIVTRLCEDSRFTLLRHNANTGKGGAMRTGLEHAASRGAQAVVFMDGDCQHRVEHLPEFLDALNTAPVVFGYRYLAKDAPWVRRTGNKVAIAIIRALFGIRRRDLLCGFMAIRADAFPRIAWTSQGYGVEAELAAIVARKRIDFAEVNVTTVYLDTGKGVKMRHAIRILAHIPGWYFRDTHDLGRAHPVRWVSALTRWGRRILGRRSYS